MTVAIITTTPLDITVASAAPKTSSLGKPIPNIKRGSISAFTVTEKPIKYIGVFVSPIAVKSELKVNIVKVNGAPRKIVLI